MSKKMQSNIMLLITALIWGTAFVAQKSGMEYIEPLTFNGLRTIVGGIILIPVIVFMNRGKAAEEELSASEKKAANKQLLFGGFCCGVALFAASTIQQFGLVYTTAGKAGFITTLYVVLVPIISIVIGKRIRPIMWLCAIMGTVGLYLLCMTDDSFKLTIGDALVLLCAFGFAAHIMIVDHFSPKMDGIKLSCIQFFTAGTLALIGMVIFENPQIDAILDCAFPILYVGVMSSGVAYTLQVVAQKHAEPTAASLILSLESVFAVIAGALILGEVMSGRELLGCAVIFAAVILAQLPSKEERMEKRLKTNDK